MGAKQLWCAELTKCNQDGRICRLGFNHEETSSCVISCSFWQISVFDCGSFFWISEILQEYILWSLANKSLTRSIECLYSQDLSALNKAVRVLMWSYLRCNSQTTDNSISTNNSFRMVVTQLSFFVFTFLYKSTKVWPIFYQVPRPTCWWKWIRELPTKNFNFCVDLLTFQKQHMSSQSLLPFPPITQSE